MHNKKQIDQLISETISSVFNIINRYLFKDEGGQENYFISVSLRKSKKQEKVLKFEN